MPGVTREQIDRAKEWDLLSYLQTYEPGELTKTFRRQGFGIFGLMIFRHIRRRY